MVCISAELHGGGQLAPGDFSWPVIHSFIHMLEPTASREVMIKLSCRVNDHNDPQATPLQHVRSTRDDRWRRGYYRATVYGSRQPAYGNVSPVIPKQYPKASDKNPLPP